MDQKKNKLTKRMLPFLMKPLTLLILTGICIVGEVIWIFLAIQSEDRWLSLGECLGLFAVGFLLGFVGGGWTSKMWDRYYVQFLLRRVKLMKTPMGRRSTIFTFLALGVPMIISLVLASNAPFLPILQSYIFGFICGMNIAIYLWARQLPD